MLSQRATIGERFPAESTAVRPLARVYAYVDLLRAATAESLAALSTGERTAAQLLVMRMTMTDESSAVGELLAALVTCHHLVTVRHHVSATEESG